MKDKFKKVILTIKNYLKHTQTFLNKLWIKLKNLF